MQSLLVLRAMGISVALLAPSAARASSGESGHVEVDGGSIYYEAAGEGPAIIMIHDGVIHRETWDGQYSTFAHSHRVIRWDRRGYGRSPAPKRPFSNLDDLLALMDALGVERATLMGCSSGGLLAIDFTLEHPDRVSALVLVGPIVSGLGFSDHFRTRGGQSRPGVDAPVAEKIEYWARRDPWLTAPGSKAARDRMEALLTENPQNLAGHGRHARRPQRAALGLLPQIEVPVLIIAGESDIPDVHAHIGAIQAGIAGSKRVVLSDSGHLTHMEVPEAFNQVVLGFLGTTR